MSDLFVDCPLQLADLVSAVLLVCVIGVLIGVPMH
jgi:hypothetical protein